MILCCSAVSVLPWKNDDKVIGAAIAWLSACLNKTSGQAESKQIASKNEICNILVVFKVV